MSFDAHDHPKDTVVRESDSIKDPGKSLSDRGKQSMQGIAAPAERPIGEVGKHREWKDKGIQMIPVANLPDPADFAPSEPGRVSSAEDFNKTSMQEMKEGLIKFEAMKPYIQNGEGANPDFWKKIDQKQGLDHRHGYQRVYETFYGDSAIKVSKDGDRYEIENGNHRIWLAKRMGIGELPARLKVKE